MREREKEGKVKRGTKRRREDLGIYKKKAHSLRSNAINQVRREGVRNGSLQASSNMRKNHAQRERERKTKKEKDKERERERVNVCVGEVSEKMREGYRIRR